MTGRFKNCVSSYREEAAFLRRSAQYFFIRAEVALRAAADIGLRPRRVPDSAWAGWLAERRPDRALLNGRSVDSRSGNCSSSARASAAIWASRAAAP